METAPYFIGTVLIIQTAGLSTHMTQLAAVLFVLLRIVYLPLYAFGVPNIRGLIWTLSLLALAALVYRVLTAVNWQDVLLRPPAFDRCVSAPVTRGISGL